MSTALGANAVALRCVARQRALAGLAAPRPLFLPVATRLVPGRRVQVWVEGRTMHVRRRHATTQVWAAAAVRGARQRRFGGAGGMCTLTCTSVHAWCVSMRGSGAAEAHEADAVGPSAQTRMHHAYPPCTYTTCTHHAPASCIHAQPGERCRHAGPGRPDARGTIIGAHMHHAQTMHAHHVWTVHLHHACPPGAPHRPARRHTALQPQRRCRERKQRWQS